MKKFKFHIILISVLAVCICLGANLGFARDISFEATVDRATIELGSVLQLTLKVSGTQSAEPVDLPDIDGFQSRYLGPSTHISVVNGQYSQSVAFMYNLYPVKTGKFQIPAVTITLDGQSYTTQPVNIEVVASLGSSPRSPGAGQGAAASSLQDRIFVIMGIPKDEFYLNERIPLTISLFVNDLQIKNIQYPEFEHTGFAVDEYEEPRDYSRVIEGIQYHVWEFKTSIFPTRTGDLTLGPTKQVCNILFKGARSRRGSRFGGLFDDDFFDGFFDSYDVRSVTLESSPLAVNVRPLPEEGKPQGFTGAVGQFDFDAAAGPKEVKVGDPVTVRMTVSGGGNLNTVKIPSFLKGKDSFKLYDPQVREEGDAKIFEQVVIPKTDTVKELPAIVFSYFDPQKRQYQTITKGPFPLSVAKVQEGEELKVVGFPQQGGPAMLEEEELGRDIIFIKDRPGDFKPAGARLYKNPLFLLCVILAIILWVACLAIYHVTHKIKTDVKFARRLQAPRQAKKGLGQARNFLNQGDQKQFYDALFKTLQSYFGNRFHMPAGTITLQTIQDVVRNKKMKTMILEDIKAVFDGCEMVRYASAKLDKGKMQDSFRQTEKIIDFFERNW